LGPVPKENVVKIQYLIGEVAQIFETKLKNVTPLGQCLGQMYLVGVPGPLVVLEEDKTAGANTKKLRKSYITNTLQRRRKC